MTTTPTAPMVEVRAARGPVEILRDYAQLTKIRVTTLVVVTAWCGFFFGEHKSGLPVFTLKLLWALAGIGMVSAGTACMNEIIERKSDALMRRTALRPLVTHSMSLPHAIAIWAIFTTTGATLLAIELNPLTALLSLLTAACYLLLYTPLKKISPLCTFVGAFPGAMPGVLGWTAARGRLEPEALVLFAIVFFWQFPHFHSIALLYRAPDSDVWGSPAAHHLGSHHAWHGRTSLFHRRIGPRTRSLLLLRPHLERVSAGLYATF